MGYDVHVTRRREWSDSEGPAIAPNEWEKVRSAHPQLDQAVRFEDGELVVKDPDTPLLKRLIAVASELGATVQGDDGEVYTAENVEELTVEPQRASRTAWLKPYMIVGVIWFALVWLVLWLVIGF